MAMSSLSGVSFTKHVLRLGQGSLPFIKLGLVPSITGFLASPTLFQAIPFTFGGGLRGM